ncbi:GCN5-related N-acetyltransferase [Pseudodesulfovibrio mercurii]|uniref:GCN5-related N-acetyltransferase n=1 Tax=Pseudodesulfovibrio mercurii TaxID=641491 RepID=F0JFB5_9BACT|nr:GNAT family N-acetyltransferase [Pseudodesulfovibrio mercurii]EGB13671.1 GCN5-related N-acetyltransferase [Pseudodesulfovibrio mercurii]
MRLEPAGEADHPELLAVWEASVRATHHFLAEEDILPLRPLILEHYFDAVTLCCARDMAGKILGFSGVAHGNLEMLFVAPDSRGRGIGTALCRHAVDRFGVTRVDVNEQNPQALGFYERFGFEVVGRSPLDGQGKPFPLLHMKLRRS